MAGFAELSNPGGDWTMVGFLGSFNFYETSISNFNLWKLHFSGNCILWLILFVRIPWC